MARLEIRTTSMQLFSPSRSADTRIRRSNCVLVTAGRPREFLQVLIDQKALRLSDAAITTGDRQAPRHQWRALGRESLTSPASEGIRRLSPGARAPRERTQIGQPQK